MECCSDNKNHSEHRGAANHTAHNAHKGHSAELFLKRFWISALLTVPVVVLAFADFAGAGYISLVLGSIIFFYGGWVFLTGAWREIKARLPGMMTLIGLATSAAYAWSVYAVFVGAEPLFWELATLISVMLLGHWFEMRAVAGAQGALQELSKLLPDTADVVRGEKIEQVALSELRIGDTVLVRPGAKVPADGTVVDGESDVNESMITGESRAVTKKTGDKIIAGTVNGDGALRAEISYTGEETFLANIMRLVAEAQASKSRLQAVSDKAAFYLTIIAVVGGLATLGAWLFAGAAVKFAVARLVAVLVIACPHALGLAVPLVASISTTKAAHHGLLVKQRRALEAARGVDIVLFDKTGTLTSGVFGVVAVWSARGEDDDEVLRMAASVDALSEHSVAGAIVSASDNRGLVRAPAQSFEALKGRGARARVEEKEVMVGGSAILENIDQIPQEVSRYIHDAGAKGQTVVFVVWGGRVRGAIALADIIREESRAAIAGLKKMGIESAIITGDSEDVARWVSGELGIQKYFSRVLPGQKAEKVRELQQRGRKVCMVGDGINDAPALAQADIGVAIGAGTNVAIESAGIILVRNDPRDIVQIIRLSRMTYAKMIQNLWWATGYNIAALPLAAGVLAQFGILLTPAIAAVFMSASTIIVAFNALLLRRKKLE